MMLEEGKTAASTLTHWLRLLRVPLAPTAVWDAVACLAFALGAAGLGLAWVSPVDWALLALTSLLIYGAGMSANDLTDRKRDRTIAPHRPLPSGHIRPAAALWAVLLLSAGAVVLGGGLAGSRIAVLVALVFAGFYDVVAKHSLVAGALSMGLVRTANASMGVLPLVASGIAPVWTMLGPVAIGLYSAGVTVLSTTEETPSVRRRIAARVLAVLAFLGVGVLPWIVAGHPTLGVLVAGGALTSISFARTPRPGPPKRQVLEMLLGLYFLSMCLATAGNGGTLEVNLVALGVAFVLIWVSQVLIRALRVRSS